MDTIRPCHYLQLELESLASQGEEGHKAGVTSWVTLGSNQITCYYLFFYNMRKYISQGCYSLLKKARQNEISLLHFPTCYPSPYIHIYLA